jgi:putative transposase
MPWKATCAVDQRLRFVAAVAEDSRGNFTQLCARFGISRAKGYKWIARYEAEGPSGLEDRKPIARSCPHRTPDVVVDRLVALRKLHPFDGPKKLRARLLDAGLEGYALPAASTVGEMLDRLGMIRPRKMRLRTPPSTEPLAHAVAPNDVWCVDFKGHFACGDGARCYPLTISDAASRYLIKCESVDPKEGPVREQFERAFHEFGMPKRIRSDNGPPFATTSLGGLSRLSIWWIQLGITPERIEPGQPQQNGRHERMHKTLKEQTATPPSASLIEQQRAFDRFRADYNDHRPHEALGQVPPKKYYEPSRIGMPATLSEPAYPASFELRRVDNNGTISWTNTSISTTKLLSGHVVGVLQTDDDEWELHYGPVLLAYILRRGGKSRLEAIR